jgi:hypothetical protein
LKRRLPPLNEEDRRVIRRLFPKYGKKWLARVWDVPPRRIAQIVRKEIKS